MTYLHNAWYVAALSRELAGEPFPRRLLDEPVVFYRQVDGTPVALQDRCPHRFVPLSIGRVRDDALECGYHGLRFDGSGACVHNPHGDGRLPRAAAVRAYPVQDRHGFVWIWMGRPERADPDLIPADYAVFSDPRYDAVSGYLRVAANYELISDNLLDLSHAEYMHPDFARGVAVNQFRTKTVRDGTKVSAYLWKDNVPISRFQRLFWDSASERADARAHMHWYAPCNLFLDIGATEVGAAVEDGIDLPTAHVLTPETRMSSHYFWAMARNVRRGDPELDAKLEVMHDKIFRTEDLPMIEAQQRAMGDVTDVMSLHPVVLEPDGAALRARRVLERLLENERREGAAHPA